MKLWRVAKQAGVVGSHAAYVCQQLGISARRATDVLSPTDAERLSRVFAARKRPRAELGLADPRSVAETLDWAGGAHRFRVDPVDPVREPLPWTSAAAVWRQQLGVSPLATQSESDRLILNSAHLNPLVETVHRAFAEHRPLELRPDDIWLTLMQGLSHHIERHPEALRTQFVAFEGRLCVRTETVATDPTAITDWPAVVDRLTNQVCDHLRPGLGALLIDDFSTSTSISRTATAITLLATFEHYFELAVECICGIPEVRLRGEIEDWVAIADRASLFADVPGLEMWASHLTPILAAIVASAKGDPPLGFWQAIYKPQAAYGTDVVTGWLCQLFPYLRERHRSRPTEPNPTLTTSPDTWLVPVDLGVAGPGRDGAQDVRTGSPPPAPSRTRTIRARSGHLPDAPKTKRSAPQASEGGTRRAGMGRAFSPPAMQHSPPQSIATCTPALCA